MIERGGGRVAVDAVSMSWSQVRLLSRAPDRLLDLTENQFDGFDGFVSFAGSVCDVARQELPERDTVHAELKIIHLRLKCPEILVEICGPLPPEITQSNKSSN